MNKNDVDHLKEWFTSYVSRFYKNDPEYNQPISLKERHTRRVCSNIITIGKELGLDSQDLVIAEIIALLHDIGRFKQYEKYHTFYDSLSENHAILGLRQVGIYKILSKSSVKQKRYISKAIAYHNALLLPEEDEKTLLFIKLIRDADKLDIWNIFTDYYRNKRSNSTLELNLPDEPVYSKELIESIRKQEVIDMKNLKTLNDFKLLQISWVFDINFKPSFKIIKKNGYLTMIANSLPVGKELSEIVKFACDYVDSMQK